MPIEIHHLPVMQREVMQMLNPEQNGVYVDATIGLGGHAGEILKMIGAGGRLIGIDRDDAALKSAGQRLSDKRAVLKKGSFSEMESLLHAEGISEVDGILFDLGVSMMQLKNHERGFSFLSDSHLDMRMDQRQPLSAWDVINKYPEHALERIFRIFGEERLSRKIARAVVSRRGRTPINTCAELSELVEGVYGGRRKVHPATRTFQALRIEVNRELDELREGLDSGLKMLKEGGRICVISYHSLEDRIVKNFIAESAKKGLLKKLTKKPRTPSAEEIRTNPSSRSAKLRAAERISCTARA
ncbi:MAG: 16S rRNA (cytosine(1402)-N(4))-methyltransferase RsmH [Nitrospirota bacterium]